MKQIYLSPHFDDVVLSCGGTAEHQASFGDEVVVLTVFGGSPSDDRLSPLAQRLHHEWNLPWTAPEARAAEDREAVRTLGATQVCWDYRDAIYRRTEDGAFHYDSYADLFSRPMHPADESLPACLAARLGELAAQNHGQMVFYAPLGVGGHVDHLIVHKAARIIAERGAQVLFYEDQPYAYNQPQNLGRALLPDPDVWWEPLVFPISSTRKLKALDCYHSQGFEREHFGEKLRRYGLGMDGRFAEGERFWRPVRRQPLSGDARAEFLVCPRCKGGLDWAETSCACKQCGGQYPIHFGIPDLRVFDPSRAGYMSREKDLERARQLAEQFKDASFEEVIRSLVTKNSPSATLAEHYAAYRLGLDQRVSDLLERWVYFPREIRKSWQTGSGLDVGCGSGVGLLSLLAVSPMVAGVDISLPELLCAKKLLEEKGLGQFACLVAGCAEALPLRDQAFANVVARDVYEHVPDRTAFLREAYRALRSDGVFLFNTTSRFVWTEPHVLLKGLGYLPRALQPLVVRLLRKRGYDIYLPSLWEFKQGVRQVLPPDTPFAVRTPTRVRVDMTPTTRKGRLVRRLPGLARLVNAISSHLGWLEGVVSRPR
jgi:SAM-dependent methyltransferase/LmbE family N-acetylglucosaminyl deacetylase